MLRVSLARRAAPARSRCVRTRYFGEEHATATTVKPVNEQRLRTIDELPVEHGAPLLGIALDYIHPEHEMDPIFDAHGSDKIVCNYGPLFDGYQVALRTAEDIQQVLVNDASKFNISWPASVEALLSPLGSGESHSPAEAKIWRHAILRVLSADNIMRLQLPLITEEFSSNVCRLVAEGEAGREVKWYREIKWMTFNVVMRAVVGTDILSPEDVRYLFPHALRHGRAPFAPSFGLKEGIPFSTYWQGWQAKHVIEKFLTGKLARALEDTAAVQNSNTVIGLLLRSLAEEGLDLATSKREIAGRLARETMVLMMAGIDTTSYVIAETTCFLVKHPQWLDTLWEEQQRLIAEYGEDINRRVLSRCAVAQAVQQESMRLKPMMKVAFRKALQDTTVGSLVVPKGTIVTLSSRKAIRSTGSGRPDFQPEQWLSEDRTRCTPNRTPGDMSFGLGPRACPGRSLANTEVVTLLALLARHVKAIDMSPAELHRPFFIIGEHPTDMPLKFVPR